VDDNYYEEKFKDLADWLKSQEAMHDAQEEKEDAAGDRFRQGKCQGTSNMAFRTRMWIRSHVKDIHVD